LTAPDGDVAPTIAQWADERRSAADDEIRAARESVENLSAQLRSAVRALHDARARAREVEHLTPADIERDAGRIRELDGVAAVTVRDGAIIVTTEATEIEHRGAIHDLGSFRIELAPDREVRVSADAQPAGLQVAWIHPHVQGDRPCLGNARVGIEKLLGDVQLVAAAEVMLRFLKVYDPETAYTDLSAWPTRS
jgi:hypothetical protein